MTTALAVKVRDPGRALATYLASQPRSARAVRIALQRAANILAGREVDIDLVPWGTLRPEMMEAVKAALIDRTPKPAAPATINASIAALRGVARAALMVGEMERDAYERVRMVRNVPGRRLPRGRALTSAEVRKLLVACARDPRPAGRRDAAIIAILFGSGMRRAELAALDLESWDDGRKRFRLVGKGNVERYASLAQPGYLDDWLRAHRGLQRGPLFVPIHRGGAVRLGQRLSSQSVYDMLVERAAQANVARFLAT